MAKKLLKKYKYFPEPELERLTKEIHKRIKKPGINPFEGMTTRQILGRDKKN
ncbi:MAG: hypothetical protein ABIB71_05185 [Candidatus Woesearchaeota archaeon]